MYVVARKSGSPIYRLDVYKTLIGERCNSITTDNLFDAYAHKKKLSSIYRC